MTSSSLESLWETATWQPFPSEAPASASPVQQRAWHKHLLPYRPGANALQNLEVWTPAGCDSRPDAAWCPQGNWIVYIHGGAWRDPFVSSTAFGATIEHLLKSHQLSRLKIAGIASINYTLSPHPKHPTHPNPPKDPSQQPDPSRIGKHPDHILDVLSGLAFLQRKADFGSNYILLGHSCGATLAFQALMDPTRWTLQPPADTRIDKPRGVIGLNGIYDIPGLIKAPGSTHFDLIPVYDSFTRGAFGDDETTWANVSPVSWWNMAAEWGVRDAKVILAQSKVDSLVPYSQLVGMARALEMQNLHVTEMAASGDHNDLWKNGYRLAEIVLELADSCFA
ncbi:Kynurenine formamidase [Fusarium oxysporum f. sp. rapae]|uniref:Kynurenine formamidase n=1 Tax=Fusarium oxysporum f. sp. rapae TaxID=485398 RepID=A0A8J5NFM0_FUSOX|nr:Kynurenine formamidase [Fusarium oxysporum f. sp. rapae]